MKEHLLKAGANMELKERDELSRIPALKTWFRTSRAVVMHLTNGTLQVSQAWKYLLLVEQGYTHTNKRRFFKSNLLF